MDPGLTGIAMKALALKIQTLKHLLVRPALFLLLLLAMASALGLAGCVLGPIEFAEEEPMYPPRINLETLAPPMEGIITVRREDCERITFSAGSVFDRNEDDVLYVWWVLDWKREDGDFFTQAEKEAFIGKMGNPDRSGPQLENTLNLSNQIDTFFDQHHSMTLFVRDRTLEDEAGQMDSYQWTFEVVPGGTYCDE